MKGFNKVCFCASLDRGCVWIAVFGIGMSGIMLIIQRDFWSIVGFALSVTSSASLLLGTLRQLIFALAIYLVLELAQIIEIFVSTVIVLVNLLIYKNFTCECDSHECEDDNRFCETVGATLGAFGSIDVVISMYFWLCVLSFVLKISSSPQKITIS